MESFNGKLRDELLDRDDQRSKELSDRLTAVVVELAAHALRFSPQVSAVRRADPRWC